MTSECPADHPHHNSFWIAADHVHCLMPTAAGRFEEYTYNFYVDETFQGRAPGRIVEVESSGEPAGTARFTIEQSLHWRGPVEWAAPEGRLAASETRVLNILADDGMYVIDVTSELRATDWDLIIGPTRHSYFNVRVIESIAVTSGGRVMDDRGHSGGTALTGMEARWVDYCGPVGGGHIAGLAVFPDPRDHEDMSWFVSDWGVVTVGPFRNRALTLRQNETLTLRYRVLVHDGDTRQADVDARYRAFLNALS